MRIRRTAAIAALLLPLSVVGPAAVAAPAEKHGSCAAFGHSWGMWARGELPEAAGTPGTVMPLIAQNYPGYAADLIHAEMTEELTQVPGTPFCDPHPGR